jgi:predicted O-methyltransferase YrrM
MRLLHLQEHLNGVPHTGPEKGAVLYHSVLNGRFESCLELGFAHGAGTCYIAGALDELGAGSVVALDLQSASRREPRADRVLAGLGLEHWAELIYSPSSYNWYLMQRLERKDRNFDFCFLDGSHRWETDGLAVLLLERLMAPGGMLIVDDLDWTFSASPTLKDTPQVKRMPAEERTTPQVRKVFELLVSGNPGFKEVREAAGMGFAIKA